MSPAVAIPLAQMPVRPALALLALDYLAQARAAATRLGAARDVEALHDVRVALRRLHSLLRAYRDEFKGTVSSKRGKALRRLARTTNTARDAEVQRTWLLAQESGLRPVQRIGYDWLLRQLRAPTAMGAKLERGVLKMHERLRPRLRRQLAESEDGECYAAVAARRAQSMRDDVLQALVAIDGAQAAATAHAARIAVKRLRYLLMPLRDQGAAVAEAVQQLRRLQDLLGELHDRQLLALRLRDDAARRCAEWGGEQFERQLHGEPVGSTAWRPPEMPGMLWLAQRNGVAVLRLYRELDERWLGDQMEQSVRRPLAAAMAALREASCPDLGLS